MHDPSSIQAQLWLNQYGQAFMRWAQSGWTDIDALRQATHALQSLLERCPERAGDVKRMAATACFASRRGPDPGAIAALVRCGLKAADMVDAEDDPRHESAILLLALAEAELNARRRSAGLDALRRLERRIDPGRADDAFSRWIRGRMHALLGDLHELGREGSRAHDAYAAALQDIAALLEPGADRDAFLQAWAATLGGQSTTDAPRPAAMDEIASMELANLASLCAIGVARSLASAPALERITAARKALAAIEAFGTPPDLSPFEMIPIIGALPVDEAQAFGDALVATIDRQRQRLERGDVPAGITDLAAIGIVRRGKQEQAVLLGRQQPVYAMASSLGMALALRAAGHAPEAESLAMEAVRSAMETRWAGPQVAAFGFAFALVAERDRGAAASFMDTFLLALAGTIEVDPGFLQTPRIRALFDWPIAIAASIVLERFGEGDDPVLRRRAAALLDLLRRPGLPPAGLLAPTRGERDDDAEAAHPLLLAMDALGRIRVALRPLADTVVVISHVDGDRVAFLVLGSGRPPMHLVAADDYRATCIALERTAYAAIRAPADRKAPAEAALVSAGQRAFAALPPELREAISESATVLLAPDFHAREDTVPFDLMHDGRAHLGAMHVIARQPSLASLAASLDAPVRRLERHRALVVAAPTVDGHAVLDLASVEQQDIVDTLAAQEFDAPWIDPERLSAEFLTDRLAYVDVLHAAAHGESGADLECLVLPHGRRLLVDDLLRNPHYRLPFAYFNTCDLGQTRYLGAGVSRGFASTLVELGAPAVIAHTKPVPDEAALQLARAFYERIAEQSVGDAWLDARDALRESGVSAAVWASAVLMGNPGHEIVRTQQGFDGDPASDVLDAFFGLDVDDARKAAIWQAANVLVEQDEDPRIEAALGLVHMVSRLRQVRTAEEFATLEQAIAVADALQHLLTRALLRLLRANNAPAAGRAVDIVALVEDAIRHLGPLAAFETAWEPLLGNARATLAAHNAALAGLETRTHMPPGVDDDDDMRRIMAAVMGAQQAAEDRYGRTVPRDVENDVHDLSWNAVVAGHPNAFEGAAETCAFAEQLARKLVRRGLLSETTLPYAPAMLAGVLRYLWDSQNLQYLAPEMAEGQAGALGALIDDIRSGWSAPDGHDWFALVEPVPRLIDDLLAFLDGLQWEAVYQHLDPRMDQLAEQLAAILAAVQAAHPPALAGCTAYVCGTVLSRNTFSPFDGSVPESIGERLAGVYQRLDSGNESRFFDYLAKGFESVRTRPLDELARWRMER